MFTKEVDTFDKVYQRIFFSKRSHITSLLVLSAQCQIFKPNWGFAAVLLQF